MENKTFMYWDKHYNSYREIDEEYISRYREIFPLIDEFLNDKDELIIYELVPYKTIKKKVTYEIE